MAQWAPCVVPWRDNRGGMITLAPVKRANGDEPCGRAAPAKQIKDDSDYAPARVIGVGDLHHVIASSEQGNA